VTDEDDIVEAEFVDVPLERASHRYAIARRHTFGARMCDIADDTITDEEFLVRCWNRGAGGMMHDYEERLTRRALLRWCDKTGRSHDDTLASHWNLTVHELETLLRHEGVDAAGIALLVEIHDEVFRERLQMCARCAMPARVLGQRNVCTSCHDEWRSRPSTPPAGGLRSALARARAKRLPATLTKEQWQATVAHFDDRCAFCGGPWCLVEHATPVELGGGTTADNCLPACAPCNVRKANRILEKISDTWWEPERLAAGVAWLCGLGRKQR